MLSLWNKPYPVQANKQQIIWSACLAGAFVWLFLQVFQPFGIHQIVHLAKVLLLLGYGLITSAIMLLYGSWLYFYMEQDPKHEMHWTVGRQVLYVMLQVFTIAIANFFYSTAFGIINFSIDGFIFYLAATFIIGFFPTLALTLYGYIRFLRKHLALADATNWQLEQQPTATIESTTSASISLLGENKDEQLELPLHELQYLSSAGNYTEVIWGKEGNVQKKLLRSSLSRLEDQLKEVESIKRCHRSFLVNLAQVEQITGNAQGYLLHLKEQPHQVPVSRSYAPQILKHISL